MTIASTEVSRILRDVWNPIGVQRLPRNEYDSYVPAVIGLLEAGTSEAALTQHLERIAQDSLGISAPRRARAAALQLLALAAAP